ncbi:AAA family ATPase [Pedobacter alluvionis]|nr:AAA family ATPase [Pedobacter alluvionis]RLJ73665.1 uncharacterized protein (TIGR02646 family) [Pedobacter alluvionis]
MIYVDRDSIPYPTIFWDPRINISLKRLEEFYSRPKDSRSQEKYSKPFDPELREIFVAHLRRLFNNKCAYCESSMSAASITSEYDHFRPKHGARGLDKEFSTDHYWWLTYEWQNLYYCCPKCNMYKSTWFPVNGPRCQIKMLYELVLAQETPLLIDPCNDRPEIHFRYSPDGELEGLTDRGSVTIEIIKLNRSELVYERRQALTALREQWKTFLTLFIRPQNNTNPLNSILEDWADIFSNYQSTRPYLGMLRQALEEWLNEADLFTFLTARGFRPFQDEDYNRQLLPSLKPDMIDQVNVLTASKNLNREIQETPSISRDLKHVYLERIEIKNFKCFSELEINFSNDADRLPVNILADGVPGEPWRLFLGENGVGKSSVLKAITLGLAGQEYITAMGLSGGEFIKKKEEEGHIKIHLVGENLPITVKFDAETISSDLPRPIVNMLAYNSIRLNPTPGKIYPEEIFFTGAKVRNLFDYTFSLIDSDKWLSELESEVFDRVAIALKDLMLLQDEDILAIEDGKAVLKRGNSTLKISELSDGYQSVFYLAVDIMATLAGEKVTFDLAEGIVLIDEIGTHLHPRWRMEVVSKLRRTFPKIRFVVSTHEPLCLRGLGAGETIVLSRNEEGDVEAYRDLPDPSELRIDQILTSDFFGLRSTMDPQTERDFDEYYALLALDQADRTEAQNDRIFELSGRIPMKKHLGDDLREELAYFAIDELLAKKARNKDAADSEPLKERVLKRVDSLWKSIDDKNNIR